MGQNKQPTETKSTFDVNNLPPEFASYLDQQRTQASNTARNNARNELMQDPAFLKEVQATVTPKVQQTLEEQMEANLRDSRIERATAKVERLLSNAKVSDEDIPTYLSMLVSDDIEGSVEKATSFVSTFNKTLESALSEKQQKAMQTMTTPQTNATSVTEQDRLQSDYDNAKKDTSPRRGVKLAGLIREAQEKGITLK